MFAPKIFHLFKIFKLNYFFLLNSASFQASQLKLANYITDSEVNVTFIFFFFFFCHTFNALSSLADSALKTDLEF